MILCLYVCTFNQTCVTVVFNDLYSNDFMFIRLYIQSTNVVHSTHTCNTKSQGLCIVLASLDFLERRYTSIAFSLSSSRSCFRFSPTVSAGLTAFRSLVEVWAPLSLLCSSKREGPLVPLFPAPLGLTLSLGGAETTSPKRTSSEGWRVFLSPQGLSTQPTTGMIAVYTTHCVIW